MNNTLIVMIISQVLFSISDFMGRFYMKQYGFSLATFLSLWFLGYMCLRTVATFGILYAFTTVDLGKAMGIFAVIGIIAANTLGFLFLKETLSPAAYGGVALAVLALILLSFK